MPRILTYNVRRCLGTDGRLSPGRIADVIAAYEPDVVALQELDVRRARTGGIDQAHAIAQALGMQMHFHASLRVMEEEYGNAILTHRPSHLLKAGALPGRTGRLAPEPRGALWASIDFGGTDVQVITTHLGLRRNERLAQVERLLGPQWLGHPACREPVILLGDFNASPRSRAYQRLASRLRDVQAAIPHHRAQPTFPSRMPMLRIDHVFVSRSIHVVRVESVRSPMARAASDHLPLMVEFQVMPVRGHKIGVEHLHE
ncbi:endonuclease/exonuclease/phosphatase family protein [Microvirga guangxiensis]|uniref:Metal-dependent hydrolase, endonuclease/exonuclease/phosphatase family n=1 Tax=Microvirga guangxiensis TaxID=549386 RepID=A0A1G5I9Q4_9HYPH|nr:endonuclease/exonuclease/phosphatase family protein [Microvirga guangxiensis]SCY72390.1 Metal-dependent hydrolase, endonuclease/exonuclease/phosphatase family [Microvirga guangxiensis]